MKEKLRYFIVIDSQFMNWKSYIEHLIVINCDDVNLNELYCIIGIY